MGPAEGGIRLQRLSMDIQNSSPLNIRKDFRLFLNCSVSTSIRIALGSRFQSLGPAWEKALRPYLLLKLVSRRCSVRCDSPGFISSSISVGAFSCKQWWTIKRILYSGRYFIFNQWWSNMNLSKEPEGSFAFDTRRAAQFWTCCIFWVRRVQFS